MRVSGVREGRGEVVVRVVHMGKGMCRSFFRDNARSSDPNMDLL